MEHLDIDKDKNPGAALHKLCFYTLASTNVPGQFAQVGQIGVDDPMLFCMRLHSLTGIREMDPAVARIGLEYLNQAANVSALNRIYRAFQILKTQAEDVLVDSSDKLLGEEAMEIKRETADSIRELALEQEQIYNQALNEAASQVVAVHASWRRNSPALSYKSALRIIIGIENHFANSSEA